jgi:hypothetical protein
VLVVTPPALYKLALSEKKGRSEERVEMVGRANSGYNKVLTTTKEP